MSIEKSRQLSVQAQNALTKHEMFRETRFWREP